MRPAVGVGVGVGILAGRWVGAWVLPAGVAGLAVGPGVAMTVPAGLPEGDGLDTVTEATSEPGTWVAPWTDPVGRNAVPMTMANIETAMTVALRATPMRRWGDRRWIDGRPFCGASAGSNAPVRPAGATGAGSIGGPHGSAMAGATRRGPMPIGRARALTGASRATAAHGTKMTPQRGQLAAASSQHQRQAYAPQDGQWPSPTTGPIVAASTRLPQRSHTGWGASPSGGPSSGVKRLRLAGRDADRPDALRHALIGARRPSL